jgi:Xaa-Pro aminopeptidase
MTRVTPRYNAVALESMLDELELDALVVRSGRNVAYLSGMTFPGTLGRLQDFAHAPRAVVILWSRQDAPVLFASRIAVGLASRTSWIEDRRGYTEYLEPPLVLAAQELKERGLERARIGVERREIGAAQWAELVAELPHAELVDCTDALEAVRNIKTSAELELIRQSAELQDLAHLEVFAGAQPGDTERELHARMIAAMLRLGAESAHGMLQASTNPITYGGEGDTPIVRGVAVRTDYVSYFQGYAANLSRMAVMGQASAQQGERYETLRTILRETSDGALRSGTEAQQVYAFARERLAAAGSTVIAGLVGHSLGLWWHQEEPMLVPGEQRPLRSGMVICLEPILDGFWHLQDEFLITDDIPQQISTTFDTNALYEMG